MAVPLADQTKLFARSGNLCAFDGCGRILVAHESDGRPVLLGEIAHIVGESPNGPRGTSSMTTAERNRYENLLVLCNVHHQLVDSAPNTYSVERLRAMKADHEKMIERKLGPLTASDEPAPWLREQLFSTALPIEHLPRTIFSAEAVSTDLPAIWAETNKRRKRGEMDPFIIRGSRLYTFQPLDRPDGPFAEAVKPHTVERHALRPWIDDPDQERWFVELLNRSMHDWTRRKGLHFDRDHWRYYFTPRTAGLVREVVYRTSLNRKSRRKVVWAPESRRTGEKRNYWLHRSVGLRFLRCAPDEWIITIRPEYRVTRDGETPLTGKAVAWRVNRRMNRAFNWELLQDVHFWREYLSDASPRILFNYGAPGQYLAINNTQLETTIEWPGMPPEFGKSFSNVEYPDNIFTFAELRAVEEDEEDTGAYAGAHAEGL